MARDFAKVFYKSKQWAKTREYCLKRDNYLCVKCGRPAEEVHHIVHLSPSNIHDINVALNPDNLACLCRDCHFKEHKHKREEIEDGYEFNADGYVVERGE